MHPILPPLIILFLAASLYAAALATSIGRRFTNAKTWFTVAIGVSLVLACLALYQPQAAQVALMFFIVGGVPMVVGELVQEFRREQRVLQRQIEK